MEAIMAQNQQHGEQSIGSGHTQDGIQGTPSGTEGATNGQGIDQGIKQGQSRQGAQDQGSEQSADRNETYQRNDLMGNESREDYADTADTQRSGSQQSAQREGTGNRQHTGERNNRQGLNVQRGIEDIGEQHSDKEPNRER
jgi:hypothetical protein